MHQQIEQLRDRLLKQLEAVRSLQDLQHLRTVALGKKGELTEILKGMATLSAEERPKIGKLANEVKVHLEKAFDDLALQLDQADLQARLATESADLSLPGRQVFTGHRHPITRVQDQILAIFTELGFEVALGPDIENDFHNFQALNIPQEHPARDMQDTFWLKGQDLLLRTHTSPVQIRTMLAQKPPVRIVAPGAVYRCDSDITHSPMFHQVEGLLVDEGITFGDLKGVLTVFLQRLFGERGVRFRPSFFPFTEPSAEIDIQCVFCSGKGCRVCKMTGWLEIAGAGSVNPEVYRAVGYPTDSTGFAFGVGVERVAMLQYGIDDIRHFYRSDLRFLTQF